MTGYKIYRSGTYLKSVTAASTSDTGLSSFTNYCYYVTAYNSAGESIQTSQLCATTSANTPANINGAWSGTYTLISAVGGSQSYVLSLNVTQSGTGVTGSWQSTAGSVGTLNGTVNGNTVNTVFSQTNPTCTGSFNTTATVNGNTITVTSGNGSTTCQGAITSISGSMVASGGTAPNTITEFSAGISAGAYPFGITAGPDGNLWFTEYSDRGNRIGRITPAGVVTEFNLPSSLAEPTGITAGPDGNLWFIESSYNGYNPKIGRINPVSGVVTEFSGVGGLSSSCIAAGPDGNLWFGLFDSIASITPLGVVSYFSLLHSFSPANCMTAGPDGNLWSTVGGVELASGTIYRITPAGVVKELGTNISSGNGFPSITAGPDGNLWFTGYNENVIGRLTPTGTVTKFSAGISANAHPYSITAGPDGNIWFTEPGINRIGRITPTGVVTEFSAGISAGASPMGISAGPDGNIWFTEPGVNRIGRITPK